MSTRRSSREPHNARIADCITPGTLEITLPMVQTNQSPRLSRATLGSVPSTRRRPTYDPATVRPGIVHLGLGNFHRAHMARYTHALIEKDPRHRIWGIVGVGLLPDARALQQSLAAQDWLYTLVERDGHGQTEQVIGSICDGVDAAMDTGELLARIDGAATRIVSLTVTEQGYCLDPASKRLDLAHPLIVQDLAQPHQPRSAVAILAEGLRRRMLAERPAFTALSCDNIQHNGDVLRSAVLDFARHCDPGLADWIAGYTRFPSCMVDRITPAARKADIEGLARASGIVDAAPIFCEPFTQWIIEDNFADGRPDWDVVGAQFVTDVAPYEKMKLRLLNASHLALAELGGLLGHNHVDEAMRDLALARYVDTLMHEETGPTLDPVPGVDLLAYMNSVQARFANPTIHDTLARIQRDGPLNHLIDPARDRLAQGKPIPLLALAIAAWLNRRHVQTLDQQLFGALHQNPRFAGPVMAWQRELKERGISAILDDIAAQPAQDKDGNK